MFSDTELLNPPVSDLETTTLQYYPGQDGFPLYPESGNGWEKTISRSGNIKFNQKLSPANRKLESLQTIFTLTKFGLSLTEIPEVFMGLTMDEKFKIGTERSEMRNTLIDININNYSKITSPDRVHSLKVINFYHPPKIDEKLSLITYSIKGTDYIHKYEMPAYPLSADSFLLDTSKTQNGRHFSTYSFNQDGSQKIEDTLSFDKKNNQVFENIRIKDTNAIVSYVQDGQRGFYVTHDNKFIKVSEKTRFLPSNKLSGVAFIDTMLPAADDGIFGVLSQDASNPNKISVSLFDSAKVTSGQPDIISNLLVGEKVDKITGFNVFKKYDPAFSKSDFVTVSYLEEGKNYIKVFEITDKGIPLKYGVIQVLPEAKVEDIIFNTSDKKYSIRYTLVDSISDKSIIMYSYK